MNLITHIIQLFKNQLAELFRNTLSYRYQWNYFILNNSFQNFRAKIWTLFPKSLVFLKFVPQELSVSLTLNSLWQDPVFFKSNLEEKELGRSFMPFVTLILDLGNFPI